MRFIVPQPDLLLDGAVERCYLSGMEGIPWRRWVRWEDDSTVLVIERETDESANFYFPWFFEHRGEMTLCTASLMEREQPYNLPVELARGTISRLRNQCFDWEMAGLSVPDTFRDLLREASTAFTNAVAGEHGHLEAAMFAERAIRLAVECIDLLGQEYVRQALAARHQPAKTLPTLLAAQVNSASIGEAETAEYARSMNTAAVAVNWREIEKTAGKMSWDDLDAQINWCQSLGLRIIGGPLLQLGANYLPDWLYLWEDDFPQIQSNVAQYVQAVVQRYKGRVQIWNCASRMNVRSPFSVSEEEKLRLIVQAIQVVRQEDPSTPLIISFDQPWGEYLANDELELSPLHFADSLVRANLGVAGLGLEMNFGYASGGTLPRDVLELSRLLDRWSMLGLPIVVFVSVPSSDATEENAALSPLKDFLAGPSPEKQKEIARSYLEVCLAKHFVQGIVWNNWCDADSAGIPHGGLLDGNRQIKPLVEDVAALRKEHLI